MMVFSFFFKWGKINVPLERRLRSWDILFKGMQIWTD